MIDLLKLLATPAVFIMFFLIYGLILVILSRRNISKRIGIFLMALGILIFYSLSTRPVSNLLAYSLEFRHMPPSKEVLSNLDIVVVLGGGFLPSGGFRKHPEATKGTYSRLFKGVEIFKQGGAKTLILSGGCSWESGESDAEIMKEMALKLGISEGVIITEARSRNTMEQAVQVLRLFPPDEKRHIGVVTSAIHMLRAESAFRKKYSRDAVIPIPADYISYPPTHDFSLKDFIPSADNFSISSYAVHELIGMIWYSLQNAV